QPRLRERAPDLRDDRHGIEKPGRAAEQRALDLARPKTLVLRDDFQPPAFGADRARPRCRPMNEHAVREGHPAEPKLLVAHLIEVIDSESNSANRLGEKGLSGVPQEAHAELQVSD